MPSLHRFPPLPAVPDGRGAGGGAGDRDDPADQFAGGMAYVPRRRARPEPPQSEASHPAREAAEASAAAPHAAASADPHDPPRPAAGHHRRRTRRRHKRKRLGPVLAVAGVVAVIGGIIGVGGGFGMVWLMRDSSLVSTISPEEEAERSAFIQACAQTLPSIDCGCLWKDARAAFVPEYRAAVLRLIDERRDLPVRLQRIRSEKLLGPELAKTVWDAAYYCARR